jgi:hypothetical protein
MEDYEDAERLLVWLVETCRERGAIVALAFPLAVSASLHLRRGLLGEAARLSDEAVALGEDAVGSFLHSVTLTTAAFVAANLGDAEACIRHAEHARAIALRLDLTSTLACAEQALGFVALGAGDAATAVVHLERAREHTRRFGSRDPSFLCATSACSSPAAPPTARSPLRCTCRLVRSSTTCAWPTASSGSAPAPV